MDRCTFKALPGLSLCGKHSKVRNPRLWTVVNGIDKKVTLISKIWKGYSIRKLIALSGPGVFKRSLCNNTEDVGTFEPINEVNVFNYFGFEEDGKVYGFDIRTLLDICKRNLNPNNPYTRQPIQINVRKRLRDLQGYRLRNSIPNVHDHITTDSIDVKIMQRWIQLCQIIEENGFYNTNPEIFAQLNKTQLFVFLSLFGNDLKTWAAEHDSRSKRFMYVFWTNSVLKKFSNNYTLSEYSYFVSSILLSMLADSVEPYTICFIIMSALYRL